MELSNQECRRAFAHWLRTGRLLTVRLADGTELKFNPYHDPRNGQFTFAPGGSSQSRQAALAPGQRGPTMARGSNSRAFEIPMTLEQTFPGLRQSPGGAIIALADNILDFSGSGNAAQAALAENWKRNIIAQIRTVDPTWHNFPAASSTTEQGRINELNDLRWQRATVMLNVKGDADALKVETLRFIQRSADEAYERGRTMLKNGHLKPRLSD